MKVLFYRNRGNMSFRLASWMRRRGVEARLLDDRSDVHERSQIAWDRPDLDPGSLSWVEETTERRYNAVWPSRALRARAAEADVVFTSGTPAASALALDVPVVLMPVGAELARLPFVSKGRLDLQLMAHLLRRRVGRAAAVVTSGENLIWAARLLGVPAGRIHRYPMPVDVERIHQGRDAELLEELEGRYGGYGAVLVCPSRKHLDPARHDYKGTETLIAAIARVIRAGAEDEIRVAWGMHGRDARASWRMLEEAGLADVTDRIEHLPRPRLHAWMSLENAVVLDQFGTATEVALGGISREALALGAPLVTATDPSDPRFVEAYGPDCPLLPAFGEDEIAGALRRWLDADSGERARVRERGTAWCREHLDWRARIDELIGVLEAVAEG